MAATNTRPDMPVLGSNVLQSLNGSINAHHIPGVTHNKPANKPSNSEAEQQAAQENLANGLCA